jgi:hypothetical protein
MVSMAAAVDVVLQGCKSINFVNLSTIIITLKHGAEAE